MDDPFRKEYRQLSDNDKVWINKIKDHAEQLRLYLYVEGVGMDREMALARTKLEEAVMWATKGICK